MNQQLLLKAFSLHRCLSTYRFIVSRNLSGWLSGFFLLIATSAGAYGQTADFTTDITSGTSPVTVQFTDASTGGVISWFWNFGNGNTSTLQNPAAVYVSPGDYTVTLTVSDGTNSNTKTVSNIISVYSSTAPELSITAPASAVNSAFTATFTFTEDVTNFELSDINVTNGTPSSLMTTSASVYTATITPNASGALTIDVPANAVLDLSSEGNVPAPQFTATADFIAPTVIISSTSTSPVTGDFAATFTFSEGVTGFELADIVVFNGTVSNLVATSASVYTATIGLIADGGMSVAVAADVVADAAGNGNTIAAVFNITANAPSIYTDGPIELRVRVREINVTNGPTDEAVFGIAFATEEYNFKLWARDNASLDNADWVGGDLLMENFIPPGNTADFNDIFYSVTYPSGKVPQFLDLRLEAWEDERGDQVSGIGTTTSRSTYNTNFCVGGLLFGACLGVIESDDNYFLGDAFISELDYRQGTEGVWFDHGFLTGAGTGVNGYQPRIETFWQRVTPTTTDLGTITAGNSAVSNGDNTSSGNNWPDMPGNDVLHTFTTTEELGVGIDLSTTFGAATTYLIDSEGAIIDTGSQTTDISAPDLAAGTYSVIVDANSAASTGTFTLTVGAIKSNFSLNPDTGCAIPHTVFFTDASSRVNIATDTWSWNFGDANTSTLQNPIHNYTATGEYTVTLTVTNPTTGASDTFTDEVIVSIPTADFSGAPLFGCGPLSVDFTDASTASGSTTITGWSWDFGDGGISTDQNPTYVYDSPGVYTVSLTTTDSNGCTNTFTRAGYVQVIGPDVDFRTTTKRTGENPLTVAFQDRTIFGAPITSWTWNFGDGGSSNLQNPSHTYNTVGTFNVSLTVTDIDGCSRTLTKTNFVNTISGAFDVSGAVYEGAEDGFSVAAQESSPSSLIFNNDGTKMFVLGFDGEDINEYHLTTAFEVSTAVYDSRFSVAGQEGSPFSLLFNDTGDKMYVVGESTNRIREYALSSAFDISTAIYSGTGETLSVSSQTSSARSLAFNSDGTKLFVLGNGFVNEYNLATAYDISTGVFAGNGERFDVTGQELVAYSLAFSPDGFSMFIMGIVGDDINQYVLSTAFDVSTAVYAGNAERFSVAGEEAFPRSMAFNNDGTKMYVVGTDGDDINQYALVAPVITGAVVGQAVDDNATLSPFSAITVQHPSGDNVSATILLDDNAKGVLTGTGLTGSGPYTLASTDAASLQTALRALIFNPTDNRGTNAETTNFTLTISDGTFSDVDNLTTVVSSAVAPAVSISSPSSVIVNGAFTVTFTFSEAITGFDAADIAVGNGSAGTVSATSTSVYTSLITPTTDGAVTVDVNAAVAQDAAANDNTAATQFSITADLTAPSVTITSAAADPIDGAFTSTFTFSEAVTGFVVGDIDVGNGGAGAFNAVSSTVYTAEITPTTNGAVTVDVNAAVAQDAAGNDNTAATQFSIDADLSDPTVTISTTASDPTNGAFTATFTFSEAVTGFVVGDITIGNGGAGAFNAVSSTVYTAEITPTTDGAVTVDVNAAVAQDGAGNDNTAATQFSITADLTAPTVTISSTATNPTNGAITATFTFSEGVTGFDVNDIIVSNGSAGGFNVLSSTVYTADITPTTDGAVTVDVNAAVAQDAAGNDNTAATQFSIDADLSDPTVTISTTASDPTNGAFTATFTFSEAVTGFVVGDIIVGNGSAGAFNTVSSTVYTAEITPTTDGAVTVDVNAAVAQDAAGNDNTAATQFSIDADLSDPTVTISTTASDPTNGAFTATFTFSEAVTGFMVGDIDVGNGGAGAFNAVSSTVYTAEITPTTDGAVTVDVNAAVAQDAAGNDNTAATHFSINADLTAPSVTISTTASDPTNGAFTATFTFSEAVTGFVVGDITVGNGSAGAFNTVSSTVYTAEITPTTDGAVTVDVGAGVVQDGAGNDNTAAIQFSITADLTAPSVTITSAAADPIDGTFTATFTFSEAVTGFVVGDIDVGNGVAGAFNAVSSTVYTSLITPTTDGAVTVDVNAAVAQDGAGNDNTAATQFSIDADLTAPSVTISTTASDPTNGSFTATFTFSEAVTGFDAADITVSNGSAGGFNVLSSTVYTAEITPTTDGAVTVDVNAAVAQDAAGNDNTAATQFSIDADLTAPSVTITSAAADPIDGTFTATFTFSEAVTGFVVGDITVGNGGAGAFNAVSSTVYTAEITPTTDGAVTVDVASNVAQDGAGNDNTAATQFSIIADLTDPIVTITSAAADPIDGAFTATFTFSEAVTGFVVGDITVGNGGAGAFNAVSSTVYTAEITPTTDGAVTVDVNAAVAQDAAGNDNTAATQFSITADLTAPSVTITSAAADPIDGAFTSTFTFSEAVTGFVVGDITVGNGSAGAFNTVSSTVYTADITPTTDGAVTVDVNAAVAQDGAGNDNTAATQFSIDADLSDPSVTISTTASDPTNDAFTATFTFSEAVTGFVVGDITIGNGSAGAFNTVSSTVYTAEITPTTDGAVTVDVNAAVAQDAAGNDNTAATQFSITADLTAPTVTISSTATNPTNGAITATFTFSEGVTGFDVNDIIVSNGSAGGFNVLSSTVYTADITPTADGAVTVDVNAAVAQDGAGNDNTAATQFSIDADLTAPSVTISTTASDPTNGTFTATFTFSEAVTGFVVGDITIGNGSAGAFNTVSSTVYTAEITPTTDGAVTVDVAANVAQDAAGNDNTAATQFSITADLTAPTVTISSTATNPTNGAITATFTFSEGVTGFDVNDIIVSNGSAGGFNVLSSTVYTAEITPTTDGAVTVDVNAAVAQDAAGNDNTAATQFSIDADLTAPSVTISTTASDPTNGSFTATFTFSEAVTGFDAADITVSNGSAGGFNVLSSTVYTAEITPTTDGAVTVDVNAVVAQDGAGNDNTAATQFSINADLTAPSVTISTTASDPINGAFTANFIFSEAVTGFDLNDLTVSNGTIGGFNALSSAVYTVEITPTTDGTVTIDIDADVAEDASTNGNTAATQFSIEADLTAPTVTITSAVADPTDEAFIATFTFSEGVTGFDINDLTVSNGTAGSFSAVSSTVYTAEITPTTDGTVTIDIDANVAEDASTNGNTAATQFIIEADLTDPRVTITSASADPTDGAFTATFTFSEAVTGFDLNDLTVSNGTVGGFNALNATVYTAEITPSADGTVTIDINDNVAEDAATNGNIAATQFSIEADLSAPTVTITSAAADPIDGAFTASFTFSEAVTGLAIGDITVSNGTTSGFIAVNSTVYTAEVTPTTDGTVTIDINADVAEDAATNGNTAATQFSIEADLTAPTVTITSAAADPVNGPFLATVTFSEAVTGFDINDLTIINGTVGSFSAASSTVYTAEITPTTDGTVTIDIDADIAEDAATNGNTAATQFSIEADLTAPTVTITSAVADPTDGAYTATFTFSEAVTGFDINDLTISNGTAGGFSAASSAVYTVEITPTTDGTVTIDIDADVAEDAATNGNTAATQFSIEADLTVPEATLTSTATGIVNSVFELTVSYSEGVTGFELTDLQGTNAFFSSFTAVQPGRVWRVQVQPLTNGVVMVDLPAARVVDQAGNENSAADQFSVVANLTTPGVTISSNDNDPANGPITATFRFSEVVTGFELADISVGNGTAGSFTAISGTTYTAVITAATDGLVTVDVPANVAQDDGLNGNTAASQYSFTADLTTPVLTATGVPSELNDSTPFTLTFNFSEAVTGFDASDLVLTNVALSSLTASNASTYEAVFAATEMGNITIIIDAGAYADLAGNLNTVGENISIAYNSLPGGISLSNTSIDENNSLGDEIGQLSTEDMDPRDLHTYSLVSGTGDDDNDAFAITLDKLRGATEFDFETQSAFSIRVKSDDGNGGVAEKAFSIAINDVNEAPTAIEPDNTIIEETDDAGVLVATLSTTDVDANETFTYSLVDGAGSDDNVAFSISGDELISTQPFNFEEKALYTVRLRVTDQGGLTFERTIEFAINNVVLEPLRDFTIDRPDARVKNFFTPNGDGQNDVWVVEDIQDNPVNEVKVYSQGGELVFSTQNYQNNWAGTFQGKSLPSGYYYYEINIMEGQSIIRGMLLILTSN